MSSWNSSRNPKELKEMVASTEQVCINSDLRLVHALEITQFCILVKNLDIVLINV